MKKYIHWLKFGKYADAQKLKQALREYLSNYSDADIKLYYADYTFMGNYAYVQCNQSYQDLELNVNSGSNNSFVRLSQKPKNITLSQIQLTSK